MLPKLRLPARSIAAALGLSLLGLGLTAPGARVDAASRSFEVTASKYRFDPDVVEVEQGDRVTLHVRSADSDHGLEIKAYKAKVLVPRGGEVVPLELVADKPGTFPFACSEYCGSGHSRMRGRLVVKARTP